MATPDVLSLDERRDLLLSVGTHRGKRPLSPVEVANLYAKMIASGATLSECARVSNLEGNTWVSRFLQLLRLPKSVQHLIVFGGESPGMISFTTATEVARLDNGAEQEKLALDALAHGLSGSEVRQIVQLRKRSKKSLQECLDEVVGMRPRIERRYVYIGSITIASLKPRLFAMAQHERDKLLRDAAAIVFHEGKPGIAKLGTDTFTLVGSEEFGKQLAMKKNLVEQEINAVLLGAK